MDNIERDWRNVFSQRYFVRTPRVGFSLNYRLSERKSMIMFGVNFQSPKKFHLQIFWDSYIENCDKFKYDIGAVKILIFSRWPLFDATPNLYLISVPP